jgi:polar amino acid transport system substrate-binding protein
MRKVMLGVVALALAMTACASDNPSVGGGPSSQGASPTAASPSACAQQNAGSLTTSGQLTIGTDNPAYPPYYAGGEDKTHPEWKFNDPYADKGFEDVVAYEVAKRMGFSKDQVQWVVAPFNQTYKPGPKDYDFAMEQISYTAKRDEAVDFSESYYDVEQSLVAVKGTPIASATTISELKDYTIAAPIGTTSYDLIQNVIQPNGEAGAYNTLADTVAALNAGQIDGMVVDAPTAFYIADPYVQEVKNSVVVGIFPQSGSTPEYVGAAFENGSPLVDCVNLALEQIKADGTLDAIHQEWLVQKTNVGEVPVFSP